jgi:hypothetical protein
MRSELWARTLRLGRSCGEVRICVQGRGGESFERGCGHWSEGQGDETGRHVSFGNGTMFPDGTLYHLKPWPP